MKVTNDEIIRNGEQDLIDGITADLDWNAVEEIFRKNHKLSLGEDVAYKNGDIVVHNNHIAYSLEFEIKVPLSIILDRQGNCIDIQSASVVHDDETDPSSEESETTPAIPEEVPSLNTTADESEGLDEGLADIFTDQETDSDPEGDRISQSIMDAQKALETKES